MHRQLSNDDLAQIAARGLTTGEVARQLRLFAHPPQPIQLDRPCTPGDGIRVLSEDEQRVARVAYDDARDRGRLLKFVPASGAASRMFQGLLSLRNEVGDLNRDSMSRLAAAGDSRARELLVFVEGLPQFAFFDDLTLALRADGFDATAADYRPLLDYLLTPRGLDYAALPKGLLKFHRYPDGSRTAFEEHLVEAAAHVRDRQGTCRLHFTVSPQHRELFAQRLDDVGPRYTHLFEARFDVGFSVQKESTDTIAADVSNRPLRTPDGGLLFRPGGHGALIENINDLRGDVIYVKNIDNVVPDRLKPVTIEWKQLLAGHLIAVQQSVFHHLSQLTGPTAEKSATDAALRFAREVLGISVAATGEPAADEERRALVISKLDRPLRVCGMVRNTGEPGGGPFWVRGSDGSLSLQIVESAQVDASAAQQRIFRSSTHFNPVDLVCAVRDRHGQPYDLHRYVDPDAVFISQKSHAGQTLKALEHPGLWNGGMGDWTTIFVEVPGITFNPVKTVIDLLRPEHQPA